MTNAASESFDVVIVGGGPAGLMAAIGAASGGAKTLILEKGDKLGRKLAISGGGRCNVTNAKPLPQLIENIPGNGRFVQSALNRFSNEDIIRFFEDLGIHVKEEDRGRVFPVTDKASTVVTALVNCVYEHGVEVWLECPVRGLVTTDGAVVGVKLHNHQVVSTSAVVLAAGGCSVPKTGSTGDAYPWARSVGHTIVEPYPTEVPLTSDDPLIRNRSLQGLSMRGVDITVRDRKGKRLTTETGDMIFTHFGLSGPAALRCSHYVSTAKRRDSTVQLRAEIDFITELSAEELAAELQSKRTSEAKKHLSNVLREWLPERLVDGVLRSSGSDGGTPMAQVKNQQIGQLVATIKAFPVSISGTLPLAQATVTGGGVSTREIDPKTMSSKKCRGLYFAGELMDVHAHTGGYNITVAFSTGRLAGQSAAEFAARQQLTPVEIHVPSGGLDLTSEPSEDA